MKAIFYSFFLTVIFTLCACKKEQPIDTTPRVTAQFDGRSQSTEGQFAANILNHSNGVQIRFPFDNTLQFYIEEFTVGNYILGRNSFNEASLERLSTTISECCFSTYVHDFSSGLFSITEIDEENGTFEGEFKCTIPNIDNPTQQIEITSGTFSNIPFKFEPLPFDENFKTSFSIDNKKYYFWESAGDTDNNEIWVHFLSNLNNDLILNFPSDIAKGIINVADISNFSAHYRPDEIPRIGPVLKTTGTINVIQNNETGIYFLFNLELEYESGKIILLENGTFEYFK